MSDEVCSGETLARARNSVLQPPVRSLSKVDVGEIPTSRAWRSGTTGVGVAAATDGSDVSIHTLAVGPEPEAECSGGAMLNAGDAQLVRGTVLFSAGGWRSSVTVFTLR